MSMYNMLFGKNPKSNLLLACLGLKEEDCGRYRDCYIDKGRIVIHTRNGCGNRDDYQPVIDELAKHPNYIMDEDDDYDCTYANIYFSFPDEFKKELIAIEVESPDITPSNKWEILLASMENKSPPPSKEPMKTDL